jgi:hypothetical protein
MTLGDPSAHGSVPVRTSLSVNAVVDHQEMLVAKSIVRWNLTDDNGDPLPTSPLDALEQSLDLLPSPVYDRVAGVVVAANTENDKESASFSDESSGGVPFGLDYTPDDSEVLV